MCGIYGSINNRVPPFNALKKVLYHRGPDSQNDFIYKNIYFFHSRLSIQDLSENAIQPFNYRHLTIVFNGEIYNHLNLRKLCHEFKFITNSDTETLLAMYEKFGFNMFEYLDGMFAFSLLDKKKNQIILARDRAGKKPLYTYFKDGSLIFSSELNALKTGINNIEINEKAISAYLRCGFFYNGYTAYKNVSEVLPGHYQTIDISTLQMEKYKYFNISEYYTQHKITNLDDAIIRLDQTLHKSVKSRLISSDLEVGAFLSGGIDSSLIVAVAAQYQNKIKTFTVKFEGEYDESHLAKMTANKYETDHHEINISMNLEEDIEKILFNYGQPFMDSSAIPSYYVSREAKKYVTVILNGDGADELFGGYRRYVPASLGIINFAKIFNLILKILPKSNNKKSIYNYIYRLLALSSKEGLDYYLSSTNDIFEDEYTFNSNLIFNEMDKYIRRLDNVNLSKLNHMLLCDFNILLPSDLLVKMDIATMSHSLEGRSPFLSKYFLEFSPSLADNFKINKIKTKDILRKLAKKYLPKDIIKQPKRGFEVPLSSWVDGSLKEKIFDALNTNNYSSTFISQAFITSLLTNKINISREKRAKMLWTLFVLENWYINEA